MNDYKAYLQSDAWKEKRKQKLIYSNYECQICCSKRDLQVHHKHYRNIGYETLDDLIVLCKTCHELVKDRFQKHIEITTLNSNKEQDRLIDVLQNVEGYNIGLTSTNPTALFKIVRYTAFEAYGRASECEDQYWVSEIHGQSSPKCRFLSDALQFILDNRK